MAGLPLVDFDRMGKVGLAGAFAGLDLFQNSSSSLTFDPSTSTLLSRNNDGSLSRIASTNSGGSILAGCALGDTYYIAGSFTSVGGASALNVASYDPSSNSFSSLGSDGPDGEVNTIYCDSTQNQVWVGGKFTSPASAVAVWNTQSKSWAAPPFGGLAGAGAEVLSIVANASQSSLLFSGSFITAFGNGSIALNGTNNPNVPFSAGATPFSSSLVPVPLTNAQIEALPSSNQAGFNDIHDVLCPAGADGPGNSWFAQDGTKAVVTVRTFAFLSANGVRVGNTFQQGRGTTGFSVTTIPDNAVRELQYVDPASGKNQTCTDPCPLLTDSSIPYQDFLFTDGSLDVTGFQFTISEWTGASGGLHILQLLSSGAFASAVADDNSLSCFAPGTSNTTRTGNWEQKNANTAIAGTTQAVLVSDVAVGTPAAQGPTFTWMPYVSASGVYDVNLLVPGCTNFQDCDMRTSVQITVFPGGGQSPSVQTISQQNTDDKSFTVYSGPIVPTSSSFSMTVTMELADPPVGNGQNGQYEIVADRVQLVLKSANVTGTSPVAPSSSNGTGQGSATGFGFFEWPLNGGSAVNASGVLSNSTLTTLDSVAFELFNAIGSSNVQTSQASVQALLQHPSGSLFLGGQFSLSAGPASGAVNIVSYSNGQLNGLSGAGLNGAVSSIVAQGNTLFVGGSFTDTSSSSTQGKLRGVAAYDVQANQWTPLQAGLDGAVESLTVDEDGVLLAAGNFTNIVGGDAASGLAAWNTTSKSWVNPGGFLVGKLTFVGNGTTPAKGESQGQILAGNVAASLQFGASGFVTLQNGDNSDTGVPQVTPLNVQLSNPVSSNGTGVVAAKAKRHHSATHSSSVVAWIPRITALFKRQSSVDATLSPLPSTTPTTSPAVLTGSYWTNTTSSREVVILAGNFSFMSNTGVASQNIAIYDPATASLSALQGNPLNGTVRTSLVVDDKLYLGGELTVEGTLFNGFAVYDLAHEDWDAVGAQSLQNSGATAVVRSITQSPSQTNKLLVAGSFAQVGQTPCRALCAYDMDAKTWSALGNGVQGEAAAVAYAGDNRDIIVVAGSLALADGTPSNVAEFSISNSTWSAVGASNALPGPVTAMEVNDGNSSSIFAAGQSADGSTSFLSFWNGQSWSDVGSSFDKDTDFSQLVMVPLQNTHSANGIVEPDRMLWISGSLSDPSFGNASSALFDGQQIIPYIMSTSSSGDPGIVASLFHSFASFSFTQRHFLATGIVILISIAISAGVVFLLCLIGVLWTLFSRKDESLKFDPAEVEDDDSTTHRPSSLLEHINAAARNTIIGASPYAQHHDGEKDVAGATSSDPFGPDASNFARAETPSEAIGGTMGGEEASRPAHARYSFDGAGEGELPMSAGQEVEILDDGDAAWWYARDTRNGREGVVPAAYVY
ncbi:Polarized growth protein rax2 [Phanerochaete sordida]|uniref:Polarized growth protein rax2 n=1 Tax=Phanerochaete sordida TaxID=48140 RepID=A0A9P3LHE6_9APHY|nr:Polarized growth protein rax2 [Phanerochaete sordida]